MFQRDAQAMQTTADTLKDLFEKAGFGPKVRQDLADYLERRDNRAGTRTVSRLISEGFADIKAASGADRHEALHKLGIDLPGNENSDASLRGGRGVVVPASYVSQPRLFKVNNNPIPVTLDSVSNSRGEPRLNRQKAVASAYLEDRVPGIVRPEIYTVAEQRGDGTVEHHAVSGGKDFKRWALACFKERPESTLFFTGTVMSRAKGVELMRLHVPGARVDPVAAVKPRVLHQAALNDRPTCSLTRLGRRCSSSTSTKFPKCAKGRTARRSQVSPWPTRTPMP